MRSAVAARTSSAPWPPSGNNSSAGFSRSSSAASAPAPLALLHGEAPAGQVEPGEAEAPAGVQQSGEQRVGALLEKGRIGDRAGSDDAYDVPLERSARRSAGSATCSQMATLSPLRTSRAR